VFEKVKSWSLGVGRRGPRVVGSEAVCTWMARGGGWLIVAYSPSQVMQYAAQGVLCGIIAFGTNLLKLFN